MRNQFRGISAAVLLVSAALSLSACATRQYVKHQIGGVESQIAEVKDTQAEQAERIDAVDHHAHDALLAANDAGMAAMMANEMAVAAARTAANADRHADAAAVDAHRALDRIEDAEREIDRHIAQLDKYSVAGQKTVRFKFDSDELTQEAINSLDDIVAWASEAKIGYMVELHGFTDSMGSPKYNFDLSERRANSVLRYLVSKNVPLHRISLVGFGKTNPVADNKTSSAREQNRRVEIRLLHSGGVTTASR